MKPSDLTPSDMKTTIIAAVAANRTIGVTKSGKSDVPWHLAEDLRRFKRRTLGHTVVMGRATWESIGSKPLPGRTNLVLTRNRDYLAPGAQGVATLEAAFAIGRERGDDELFVVGGAVVYAAALAMVDRLDLTLIERDYAGDAFFPEVDWSAWREIENDRREAEGDAPAFAFTLWKRRERV
ncbi:MAG TPA: dihydrofolate reductase [Thermoanaerobaculia bacterium]|jgi:dihydrofolate reductase|nr:dihydrofolate reductase [Thermoanaerobaculia bacterium]